MIFPKLCHVAGTFALVTLASVPAGAQVAPRPHFTPEPVSAFAEAYARMKQVPLDAHHLDEKHYRAFHFSGSGPAVIIARSVTVDAAGHLHIKQEPGTVAHGRVVSGGGDTHILLPVSVTPPQ